MRTGIFCLGDEAIAVTAGGFESLAIEDGNPAACVTDQALPLQRACRRADAAARDAEYLPGGFVGEEKSVVLRSIICEQQPSRQPLFSRMKLIADCSLRDLLAQGVRVVEQQLVDLATLLDYGLQTFRFDPQRLACNLHLGSKRRSVSSRDSWKSDHSLAPDHRGFDGVAVFRDGKQRDDPAGDEPSVIDRIAGVIENIARVQPDSFQGRGQALVDGRGENSQQSVFVCGLH